MKILQLNPAFYPAFSYGGTVNVSYNLSKALAKRGHDVTVFTSDTIDKNTRQIERYLEHEGIKIYYFRNISNRLAWQRYLLYPGLIRGIKKHIRDFDIVHLHGTRNFQNIVAAYYAKKYNIPYVVQAHGSLPFFSQHEGIKTFFDKMWGNEILNNLSKALALNQTEHDQYISMGVPEKKIEIIPNGLSLSEFNSPQKGIFRKKYSLEESDRIILYVGRIHRTKGLDQLIRAFAIVNRGLNNSLLVLVGPDDDYKDKLEQLSRNLGIQGRVRFIGFVSAEDKYSAYADSDVFVTPIFSGFPITFLEACASGLPIITTCDGDCLNWIHNNVGLVVDNDEEQIASAIIRILSFPSLKKEFGKQGVTLIREKFNWTSIVDSLESIYSESIETTK